jgi:hypothetical protein
MYMKQHIHIFAYFLALLNEIQWLVAAADECLTVETVQGLDLDAFISKPWYGTFYQTRLVPDLSSRSLS